MPAFDWVRCSHFSCSDTFYYPDLLRFYWLKNQFCLSLSRHFIQISPVSFCIFCLDIEAANSAAKIFRLVSELFVITFLIHITRWNKVDKGQFGVQYTKLPDIDWQISLIILVLQGIFETSNRSSRKISFHIWNIYSVLLLKCLDYDHVTLYRTRNSYQETLS